MSVERRGGNDYSSTVQRRGEKKITIVPAAKTPEREAEPEAESLYNLKRVVPHTLPPQRSAQSEGSAEIERRVEQRMRELEANPSLKKYYIKKYDSMIATVVIVLFLFFAVPQFAGIALGLLFVYFFMTSLTPKKWRDWHGAKLDDMAVTYKIGYRLKKQKNFK